MALFFHTFADCARQIRAYFLSFCEMAKQVQMKRRRVAVLVETATNWGRQVVTGILSYDREHGPWHIFVEPRGMEEVLSVPAGWQGDGIIARVNNPRTLSELKRLACPVVNVSGIVLPGANFPRVSTDLQASGRLAAEYFLERGYKHCGYFSLFGLSYVATHQTAFMETLRRSGAQCAVYSVRPDHGAESNWNLNFVHLIDWLRELPKPVGILSWNASGSREVLYAAQEAGLLVPEEVAVLSGTDDDLFCKAAQIPLSGIRPSAVQIGYQAASLLDYVMHGKSIPKTDLLVSPLGITSRQSTDTLAIQDPGLLKAVRYIRANAMRNLRVSEVVSHSGLSRRMLEVKFVTQLQRTPAQEIRRVHLEHARELLEQTDIPMPDVAEASGFGSPERLAVVFRKEMGQSPLRYRKEIRTH
jgi:LacI family transcriptional regulator